MLSGSGLCDELIARPEESYRLCCVVLCDLETSRIGAPYIYDLSRLRVNIALFLLGDSSASEFCVPTFRNTLFDLTMSSEEGEILPCVCVRYPVLLYILL